jgi:hypothetical protein
MTDADVTIGIPSFCSFFLLLETIIPFTVNTDRTPTMNFFVSCRAV